MVAEAIPVVAEAMVVVIKAATLGVNLVMVVNPATVAEAVSPVILSKEVIRKEVTKVATSKRTSSSQASKEEEQPAMAINVSRSLNLHNCANLTRCSLMLSFLTFFFLFLPSTRSSTHPLTTSCRFPMTTCRVRPWLVPKSRLYPQSDLLYYYEPYVSSIFYLFFFTPPLPLPPRLLTSCSIMRGWCVAVKSLLVFSDK